MKNIAKEPNGPRRGVQEDLRQALEKGGVHFETAADNT